MPLHCYWVITSLDSFYLYFWLIRDWLFPTCLDVPSFAPGSHSSHSRSYWWIIHPWESISDLSVLLWVFLTTDKHILTGCSAPHSNGTFWHLGTMCRTHAQGAQVIMIDTCWQEVWSSARCTTDQTLSVPCCQSAHHTPSRLQDTIYNSAPPL